MNKKYPIAVSFYIVREPTHTVEVKAWHSEGLDGEQVWRWNVYGHVFEGHAWFSRPDLLKQMPLHCGATFDEVKTTAPAFGIKYDWQKERKTYTFGSDYGHLGDSENHPSPFNGIPCYVEDDALELAEWLKERASTVPTD